MTREQLTQLDRDWAAAGLMAGLIMHMQGVQPEPPKVDFSDIVIPETIGWLDDE